MECWFYWLLIMRENYFVVILFFYCCADLCCWELQCFMSFSRVIGGYLSTLWICLPGCHMRMLIFGGSCSRFLWFLLWEILFIGITLKRQMMCFWHGISVIWNIWQESLLGWWSYFWYWMLFPCLFVCSFIYLRVALDLMSDFTFSICWQFLCQPCYSCPVWFSW